MLYRTLSVPLSMQVELTTQCNNTCRHCYNYQKQSGHIDTTMTKDNVHKLISLLSENKVFITTFTGGEPLIAFEALLEGIKQCNQHGIKCSINSNLTLMTESKLERMMKVGKFSILTSLASHKPEVNDYLMGRIGSHRQTIESIKMLTKNSIRVSCNMVVTKINANDVYDTGLFVRSLGVSSFSATKASPPLGCADYSDVQPSIEDIHKSLSEMVRLNNDTGMHVDILECYPKCFFSNKHELELFSNRRCSAGVTSGTTDPDGNIRPCSHSNRNYGNIFSEPLSVIYNRMSEWRTGELIPPKCLDCKIFAHCSGGCRCEAESSGCISGMDPYAEPGNVSSLESILIKKEKFIGVSEDDIIYAPNKILTRTESFGNVIFSNGNFAFVGKEASELICQIQKQPMTIPECAAFSNSSINKVIGVLNYLVSRTFLKISEDRR